jgi:sulfite oxidase
MFHKTRRRFLQNVAAVGGALMGGESLIDPTRMLTAAGADDPNQGMPTADAIVPGKDARLVVHKASPCEIETPPQLLAEHRLTPASLLFVRNNQQLADAVTLAPPENADDWACEWSGLIEGPRSIRVGELRGIAPVDHEIVLQCSGNGRKLFSQAAPCSGSPWELGAVANVRFGGASLKGILEHFKISVDPRARFLTAEGRDAPSKPDGFDFEHSVPLEDALRFGFLALTLNGEPLPAVHGGPLRLVMPGYYGTMHVKWISRLRFEAAETANHHQVKRYRTPFEPIQPGTAFESTLANSEPNWRMKVKSIIFSPTRGEEVRSGQVEVRGVAFNDGRAKIERVELSTDGNTWSPAALKPGNGPFAWSTWSGQVALPRGEHVVMCRAIDALGRTQPLDGQIHWNPAGYTWNGVHRVQVKVT